MIVAHKVDAVRLKIEFTFTKGSEVREVLMAKILFVFDLKIL